MLKPISFALTLSLLGSGLAISAPAAAQTYGNDHRMGGQEMRHETQLPQQYRHDRYVVQDWRQRRLAAPPRGYHWVRYGNDNFVLVAINGGQISSTVRQNQYGYSQQWNRGQRLEREYRNSRYVVSDWRGARLRNPGRGRHWVRTDNQYILISIRSGIVYGTAARRR